MTRQRFVQADEVVESESLRSGPNADWVDSTELDSCIPGGHISKVVLESCFGLTLLDLPG